MAKTNSILIVVADVHSGGGGEAHCRQKQIRGSIFFNFMWSFMDEAEGDIFVSNRRNVLKPAHVIPVTRSSHAGS